MQKARDARVHDRVCHSANAFWAWNSFEALGCQGLQGFAGAGSLVSLGSAPRTLRPTLLLSMQLSSRLTWRLRWEALHHQCLQTGYAHGNGDVGSGSNSCDSP